MRFDIWKMRFGIRRIDRKRDRAIPLPAGVTQCRNLSYGPHGKWSRLDVYYPEGTQEPLPTIVSIHGGGFVYGTKEIYRRYCMDMARRGFAVVNFNYRLAPENRFPAFLRAAAAALQIIYTFLTGKAYLQNMVVCNSLQTRFCGGAKKPGIREETALRQIMYKL